MFFCNQSTYFLTKYGRFFCNAMCLSRAWDFFSFSLQFFLQNYQKFHPIILTKSLSVYLFCHEFPSRVRFSPMIPILLFFPVLHLISMLNISRNYYTARLCMRLCSFVTVGFLSSFPNKNFAKHKQWNGYSFLPLVACVCILWRL